MYRVLECFFVPIFFLILLLTLSLSETITGKVISIADGDTITILAPDKEKVKIRLSAVDTPEGRQSFGKKAKKFTSSMVRNDNLKLTTCDNRILTTHFLSNY